MLHCLDAERDHPYAVLSANAVPYTIFGKEDEDLVQMSISKQV